MTALAGRIDFARQSSSPEDRAIVSAMLGRMRGRCRDGIQIEAVDGGWLAIGWLHFTKVPQFPVANPVDGITILADARIDNAAEIFDASGTPAEARSAATSSDVMRMAYLRWGADFVRHLRGDFAFALWDPRLRELHCARDPLGLRLLYYNWDGRVLRIATDPIAVLADASVSSEPNDLAIARYLVHCYSENSDTFFREVQALPSGHRMCVSRSGLRLQRYWQIDASRRLSRMDDEGYARLLRDALAKSVNNRLRSKPRVAVHVSGGMDSSSVACEIERQRRLGNGPCQPPTAVRLAFPGLDCDESLLGRAVAERWQLPLVEIDALSRPDLTGPERAKALPNVPYHPCAYIYEALLEAAAERGIRSIVTGQAGDLCLTSTGHEPAAMLVSGRLRDTARWCARQNPTSRATWRKAGGWILSPFIPWRVRGALRHVRGVPAQQLLSPRLQEATWEWLVAENVAYERRCPDLTLRALLLNIEGGGTQHFNTCYTGRIASAHGMELIHPFLDVALVELLVAMPLEQRSTMWMTKPKPVLRRAMRDSLPACVYRRTDAAEFSSFIAATVFGRHRDDFMRLLENSRLVERGIVESVPFEAIRHSDTSERGWRRSIVNLAAMEIWLRQTEL